MVACAVEITLSQKGITKGLSPAIPPWHDAGDIAVERRYATIQICRISKLFFKKRPKVLRKLAKVAMELPHLIKWKGRRNCSR